MRHVDAVSPFKRVSPRSNAIGFDQVSGDKFLCRLGQDDIQLLLKSRKAEAEQRRRHQTGHNAACAGNDQMWTDRLSGNEMKAPVLSEYAVPYGRKPVGFRGL